MKLLIRRDETSNGFPAPDQVEVGELVINSKTGKLYSKLIDGSIIEWIGQKICFEPIPLISFSYNNKSVSNIDKFCCAGDNLLVTIDKLKPSPAEYSFAFIELTQNSEVELITIAEPQYSIYSETIDEVTTTFRKAVVPINLSIKSTEYLNISIFKFIVYDQSQTILAEQILTFKCVEATQ